MKWNMGWMNDMFLYFAKDPIHRRFHQQLITFSMLYAFTENFLLPVSHDEVVHGKRALVSKMPGDEWQRFANARAFLAYMFAHPGKKLMFMGTEFGQTEEWNHERGLMWWLLQFSVHLKLQTFVKELNALYRREPSLFEVTMLTAGLSGSICRTPIHPSFPSCGSRKIARISSFSCATSRRSLATAIAWESPRRDGIAKS
jgi:1,4-alpha-glucan branching enzyme